MRPRPISCIFCIFHLPCRSIMKMILSENKTRCMNRACIVRLDTAWLVLCIGCVLYTHTHTHSSHMKVVCFFSLFHFLLPIVCLCVHVDFHHFSPLRFYRAVTALDAIRPGGFSFFFSHSPRSIRINYRRINVKECEKRLFIHYLFTR